MSNKKDKNFLKASRFSRLIIKIIDKAMSKEEKKKMERSFW